MPAGTFDTIDRREKNAMFSAGLRSKSREAEGGEQTGPLTDSSADAD